MGSTKQGEVSVVVVRFIDLVEFLLVLPKVMYLKIYSPENERMSPEAINGWLVRWLVQMYGSY